MRNYFFRSPQSGSGLISVLVAVAITGMVSVLTMQIAQNQAKFKKSMGEDIELSIAKTIIKSKVSCKKSLPKDNKCVADQAVLLKDKQGRDYMKTSGKGLKIGMWNFKATCNSEGSGVQIRFARLKKSGNINSTSKKSFRKDPLTGTVKTWDDDKSLLFGKNTTLCPDTIIMGFKIDKECVVKRSKIGKKDFVTWCPKKQPKLYSCLQIDDSTPGSGNEAELQDLSGCSGDGTCQANGRYSRKNLGSDAIYYERVQKTLSGKKIDGCLIYDHGHSHTPHKADVMCCR